MRKLLAVLALSLSATAAYAMPAPMTQPKPSWTQSERQALDKWLDQRGDQFEDWFYATWGQVFGLTDPDSGHSGSSGGSGGSVAAPELDPAAALAALTLLTGGLAVLRGRRSKR